MGAKQSSAAAATQAFRSRSPSSSATTAPPQPSIFASLGASLPPVVGFEPKPGGHHNHGLDHTSYVALQYLRHECTSLAAIPTDILLIMVQYVIGYRYLYRFQFDARDTSIQYNGIVTCVNLGRPEVSLRSDKRIVPLVLPAGNPLCHAAVFRQPGTENHIVIPPLKLWRSSFTISFWVWPASRERHCIIGDWSYPWSWMCTIETSGEIVFQLRRDYDSHGSDPRQGLVEASALIPVKAWSHIIVTWNREDKRFAMYVNGKHAASMISPWKNTDFQQTDHRWNHLGWKQDDGNSLGFTGAIADLCVLAPYQIGADDSSDEHKGDDEPSQPKKAKHGSKQTNRAEWPSEPPNGERVRRPEAMWLPGNESMALTNDDDIYHYYQHCATTGPLLTTSSVATATTSATPSDAPVSGVQLTGSRSDE